jgi:hypothetical protein
MERGEDQDVKGKRQRAGGPRERGEGGMRAKGRRQRERSEGQEGQGKEAKGA